MTRLKGMARTGVIIAGAMLYLLSIAYLYSRPEVSVLRPGIAPVFDSHQGSAETGCHQNQTDLSEEAVKKRLQQNRRWLNKADSVGGS
jgi:hypothetical protein